MLCHAVPFVAAVPLSVNSPLIVAVPATCSWFIELLRPLPVAYDYGLWLLHLPYSSNLHVGLLLEKSSLQPSLTQFLQGRFSYFPQNYYFLKSA